MEIRSTFTRLFAFLLGVLLAACSAPRYTAPASAAELTHLVLVIRELPDGPVSHSWQRAERFDVSQYKHPADETRERERERIVLASGPKRDCHRSIWSVIATAGARGFRRATATSHEEAHGTTHSAGSDASSPTWIARGSKNSSRKSSRPWMA
jgi:hypothetical protein